MTYSSALAVNRAKFTDRNHSNIVSLKTQDRVIGPVSNTVILIVLACLLGLLYLTQVTKTNTFSYEINTLQQQQSSLVSQQNNLEVASAQLQSVNNIQNSPIAKTLTSITPSATLNN